MQEVDITRNETNIMPVRLRLRVPRRSSRTRRAPNRLGVTLVAQKKPENRDEPSLKLAMNSNDKSEWNTAITTELNELHERGKWVLVPRPERTKVLLPCKIVLKIKRRPYNTIKKYKARLVALGCLQSIGDYDQTFSPVIGFTTVRMALSIAGIEGSPVHHMDVTGAFLYGDLEEEVYMDQPKGFEDKNKPNHVCKLIKNLYGLKQAPRVWYIHLNEKLQDIKFTRMEHSYSAFILERNGSRIVLLMYVDDILLISKSEDLISEVKKELLMQF